MRCKLPEKTKVGPESNVADTKPVFCLCLNVPSSFLVLTDIRSISKHENASGLKMRNWWGCVS